LKLIFKFSSVCLYYIAVTNIFKISFTFSFDNASNYKVLIFYFFLCFTLGTCEKGNGLANVINVIKEKRILVFYHYATLRLLLIKFIYCLISSHSYDFTLAINKNNEVKESIVGLTLVRVRRNKTINEID
jgi:hypothetical protein